MLDKIKGWSQLEYTDHAELMLDKQRNKPSPYDKSTEKKTLKGKEEKRITVSLKNLRNLPGPLFYSEEKRENSLIP